MHLNSEVFDLAKNHITTIDNEIGDKYPSLISLNVQENELTSLTGLDNLDFLQILCAASNKVTTVPVWLLHKSRHF